MEVKGCLKRQSEHRPVKGRGLENVFFFLFPVAVKLCLLYSPFVKVSVPAHAGAQLLSTGSQGAPGDKSSLSKADENSGEGSVL